MIFRWRAAAALWLGTPAALFASPALAVDCGITGSTTQSIGNYNPFTGGISQTSARIVLTRRTSGNSVTQKVNFVFLRPANAPAGLDIRFGGSSILASSPAGIPLSVNQPPPGSLYYAFGGNREPDRVGFDVVVTVPPGMDLRTGQTLDFDILYVCTGTDSMGDVPNPTVLYRGLTLTINVLSALQASYVGQALDFGEVGAVTNADAGSRAVTGQLRVASSGPYYVAMQSANGYRMTYPGGSVTAVDQSIGYFATLLGQTRTASRPTYSRVYCQAAGIAGETIPLTVRLGEGGAGKAPSNGYRDVLTITVTPAATLSWPPPADC